MTTSIFVHKPFSGRAPEGGGGRWGVLLQAQDGVHILSQPPTTFQTHQMSAVRVRDNGTGRKTEAQSRGRNQLQIPGQVSDRAGPGLPVRGHIPKARCLKGLTGAALDPPPAPRRRLGTSFIAGRRRETMGGRGAQQVPPEGPRRLEARGPLGPCGTLWAAAWTEDGAGNWRIGNIGPT